MSVYTKHNNVLLDLMLELNPSAVPKCKRSQHLMQTLLVDIMAVEMPHDPVALEIPDSQRKPLDTETAFLSNGRMDSWFPYSGISVTVDGSLGTAIVCGATIERVSFCGIDQDSKRQQVAREIYRLIQVPLKPATAITT